MSINQTNKSQQNMIIDNFSRGSKNSRSQTNGDARGAYARQTQGNLLDRLDAIDARRVSNSALVELFDRMDANSIT